MLQAQTYDVFHTTQPSVLPLLLPERPFPAPACVKVQAELLMDPCALPPCLPDACSPTAIHLPLFAPPPSFQDLGYLVSLLFTCLATP